MRATLLLSGVLLASTQTAYAGNIERGLSLSLSWCVSCHVVAPDATGGDAGPTFASLASLPGQTEQALHNWLAEPHPPMSNLDLTAVEFDDLAAYIMSLNQ